MSTGYINHKKAPYQVRIVSYRCERCFRRWQSANGSLSDYQLCKNCLQKCYPGTYKWQAPNKKGNQNPETFIAHNTELCGKCIRLGFSCMELGVNDDEDKGGIVVNNIEGDEITLEHTNLSNYIQITDKTTVKSKKTPKKPEQQVLINNQQETGGGRRRSLTQRIKERQEWFDVFDADKKKKVNKDVSDGKDDIKKTESNIDNKIAGKDEVTVDSHTGNKTPDTSNKANHDVEDIITVNSLITESVIHCVVIDIGKNDLVNVENATCNSMIMESVIDYAAANCLVQI